MTGLIQSITFKELFVSGLAVLTVWVVLILAFSL